MFRVISFATLVLFGAAVLAGPAGFNPERLGRLINACTKDVSRELVEGYKRLEFPEDQITKCVMRCIVLNMGTWDDLTGINMDSTWQMLRSGRADSEKEKFVEEHLSCIRRNLATIAKDAYCDRLYGTYLCYKEDVERLKKEAVVDSNC